MCGLKDEDYTFSKKKLVPNPNVFTLFYQRLAKHQVLLDAMFSELVEDMYASIDGFGTNVARDGKYLDSFVKNDHRKNGSDGRCDLEAAYSVKEYQSKDKNRKVYRKEETHYGYRTHVLVDTKTELPICFVVTPANADEKQMIK